MDAVLAVVLLVAMVLGAIVGVIAVTFVAMGIVLLLVAWFSWVLRVAGIEE